MDNADTAHPGHNPRFHNRLTAAAAEIFAPVTAVRKSRRRTLLIARQAAALLGVFGTVIQIVVWLMIAVIGDDLDSPWWLWSALFTTLVVAGLTAAHRLVPDNTPAPDASARHS